MKHGYNRRMRLELKRWRYTNRCWKLKAVRNSNTPIWNDIDLVTAAMVSRKVIREIRR